jgi:hypothetical protein
MGGRSGPFWDGVEAFLAAMLFDTVGPALVATRAPTSSSRPSSSVWAFLRPVRPEVPEHPGPLAVQHRDQADRQLVDQPGPQVLLAGVGATHHRADWPAPAFPYWLSYWSPSGL